MDGIVVAMRIALVGKAAGSIAGVALLPVLAWFAMAYGELPRLWSRHEHRLISRSERIVSYTSQDIPGDPINLLVRTGAAQLDEAYVRAGWSRADAVEIGTGVGIVISVLIGNRYTSAPVSPLYLHDARQDVAYELDIGRSADRRHHVRFWRVGPDWWAGAASLDRGVGLSLYTLQVTHHIGPDVDAERDLSGSVLSAAGAKRLPFRSNRIPAGALVRNGGGDPYRTDGRIGVWSLRPLPAS